MCIRDRSLVSKNGYNYYGCESSKGLGKYNKEHFMKLREDFNAMQNKDYYYYVMLYVLIVYAFNKDVYKRQICVCASKQRYDKSFVPSVPSRFMPPITRFCPIG